jgi:hypothetical protein
MSVIRKTDPLLLDRKIIAVCSEIYTKHANVLCGEKVGLLDFKRGVYTVTTEL